MLSLYITQLVASIWFVRRSKNNRSPYLSNIQRFLFLDYVIGVQMLSVSSSAIRITYLYTAT